MKVNCETCGELIGEIDDNDGSVLMSNSVFKSSKYIIYVFKKKGIKNVEDIDMKDLKEMDYNSYYFNRFCKKCEVTEEL